MSKNVEPGVITITRSDSQGKGKTWWWISGDTKPKKDILSNAGARFSRRRIAWYYIDDHLPEAIRALETPKSDAVLGTVQDAQHLLEQMFEAAVKTDPVEIAREQAKRLRAKLHVIRDREFPGSTAYQWTITGQPTESDKVILNRHCSRGVINNVWRCFEQELPDAVREIVRIEGTPDTPKRQQSSTMNHSDATSTTATPMPKEPTKPEPEPIRIFKPQRPAEGSEPDAVQAAIAHIAQTKAIELSSPTVFTTHNPKVSSRHCTPIGQQYIGELTGNISGNVLCFGYAIHKGVTVYVNMGGPRMAVEAIRAKLGKGEVVNLTPWDGPAIELTAGEKNTGKYKDFFANMPEAKFTSLILVHEMLVEPNYGGKSTTFIIRTHEAQAIAKLKHHITELVKVPVFDAWANYLWQAGQTAMLVRRTRSGGEIDIWTVTLDIDAWTRLITGGLDQAVISLPQ